MDGLTSDVRYGLRRLARSPGFSIAAVLCISLGIGANTAVFSFARALLFRESPAREPERLVRMFIHWNDGPQFASFSWPNLVDMRERAAAFEAVSAEAIRPIQLSTDGVNERIVGSLVTVDYFDTLGIPMRLGRAFLPEEGRTPGAAPVVVLSHSLWRTRFAGDDAILGTDVVLNGRPFSVVGVAAVGFRGTNVAIGPELWVPMMMQETIWPGHETFEARGHGWIGFVTGRMRPGVSFAEAQASVDGVVAGLAEEYPDALAGMRVELYPESQADLHPRVRGAFMAFLSVMFAVVGLILLLTCSNVAGLLLARYAARSREMAVRLSLGASRGRLMRQLLVENTALALVAGGSALAAAVWLTGAMSRLQPPTPVPLHLELGVDPVVIAFTMLVSLATAVIFGLTPALHATRVSVVPTLKDGSAGQSGMASRARRVLVVGQVGLSMVLLVAAGLGIQNLSSARSLDPGFDADGMVLATLDLSLQGYGDAEAARLLEAIREDAGALPGTTAVGYALDVPLSLSSRQRGVVPEGYVVEPGDNRPSLDYNIVDDGYFDAMGIPVLRGRGFDRGDADGARRVLVVNESFARRFWPDQDPIGHNVTTAGEDHAVIGIVKDGKYFSLGEDPKPFFYLALAQHPRSAVNLHLRTPGDAAAVIPSLREVVRRHAPTLPADVRTMHAAMGFALLPAQLAAWSVGGFALVALALAGIGLYGLLAYLVRLGTRDIAIRIAVGATTRDVMRHVVGRGMRLVGAGLVAGFVLAAVAARLIEGMLYGVSASDPVSYLLAATALTVAALLATIVPALRAARVDPATAMRID